MALPDLDYCTITELSQGLIRGLFTSSQLVKAHIARTAEVNDKLHAVLEFNNLASIQAAACDAQRRQLLSTNPHAKLPLLHGIPILVKDIISTASPEEQDENLNTSAGSFALLGAFPSQDAPVVARLRQSGAIILGKTNVSEWAHFRSLHPSFPAGWSARGGQTINPYFPLGNPGGSSSGSAVAAAVGLASATLGTETHGSISCPSSMCGVVGLKPTVELVSREGVIPISKTQDTVGPICANVSDVARVLQAIASPPLPSITNTLPDSHFDYLSALSATFLSENKIRIGIPRATFCTPEALGGEHKVIMQELERTLDVLRCLGGVIVDPADIPNTKQVFERGEPPPEEERIMCAEFKDGINRYLADLDDVPSGVRTLKDLITFNELHEKEELPPGWTDIDASNSAFIEAEKTLMDEKYHKALEWCRSMARDQGIDAALQEYCVDVLVVPCSAKGWTYPCMAGYPSLTMPIGFFPESTPPHYPSGTECPYPYPAPCMPFAISFFGTAWSERTLIGCAFASERELQNRGLDRARGRFYDQARPKTQLKDVPSSS